MQVAVVIPKWATTFLPTSLLPSFSLPPHLLSLWLKLATRSFQVPQILPGFSSFFFFIILNVSFFLPTGWVVFWVPCTHKGYFLTCSCNSQKAENSRKTAAQISKAWARVDLSFHRDGCRSGQSTKDACPMWSIGINGTSRSVMHKLRWCEQG